jgi:excisionase family DNA binding protein
MNKSRLPIAYSIAGACEVSNLGRTTIYAAIKRGELETCKIGRRRLVTDEALRAWLAAMRCKPS